MDLQVVVPGGPGGDRLKFGRKGRDFRSLGRGLRQADPDVQVGVPGLGHGAGTADGVDGLHVQGCLRDFENLGHGQAEITGEIASRGQIRGQAVNPGGRGRSGLAVRLDPAGGHESGQHVEQGRACGFQAPASPGQTPLVVGQHGQPTATDIPGKKQGIDHGRHEPQARSGGEDRRQGRNMLGLGQAARFVLAHGAEDVRFVGGAGKPSPGEITALGAYAGQVGAGDGGHFEQAVGKKSAPDGQVPDAGPNEADRPEAHLLQGQACQAGHEKVALHGLDHRKRHVLGGDRLKAAQPQVAIRETDRFEARLGKTAVAEPAACEGHIFQHGLLHVDIAELAVGENGRDHLGLREVDRLEIAAGHGDICQLGGFEFLPQDLSVAHDTAGGQFLAQGSGRGILAGRGLGGHQAFDAFPQPGGGFLGLGLGTVRFRGGRRAGLGAGPAVQVGLEGRAEIGGERPCGKDGAGRYPHAFGQGRGQKGIGRHQGIPAHGRGQGAQTGAETGQVQAGEHGDQGAEVPGLGSAKLGGDRGRTGCVATCQGIEGRGQKRRLCRGGDQRAQGRYHQGRVQARAVGEGPAHGLGRQVVHIAQTDGQLVREPGIAQPARHPGHVAGLLGAQVHLEQTAQPHPKPAPHQGVAQG